MTKRTKLLSSSLALSVVLALTGCGGGDDSSSSSTSTGTGYYLDSAVAGVDYVCGTQSGTTDAAGAFTFQVGQDCTFKVNNIVIKSVAANALSNGVKIVEDNATVAQFLQTLDVDGDATNGIEVTKEVVKALKDINVSKLPVGDVQLSEVFTQIKNEVKDYNGTIVSATDAEKHLQTTQTNVTKSLFAGKTLYIIWSDESDHGLGKATFNKDVTESTYEGLKDDTDNDVDSVKVEGKNLIWSDGSYSEVTAVRPSYILMTEYDDKGTRKGTSSMYFSRSVAEAAYNAKYVPTPIAPATPVTPSSPGSSSSKPNLNAYSAIEIVNNVSATHFAEGKLAPGFSSMSVASNYSCKDFGFTNLVNHDTAGGIESNVYMNMATQRICTDANYANSLVGGSANYIIYGNLSK